MKKIILLLMVTVALQALPIFSIKKVGTIDSTWSVVDKDVYETCINGVVYYVTEAGYRSSLAIKEVEINHPILGKIFQPVKCETKEFK